MASSPLMPSKPCEKFPGSNRIDVVAESVWNSASRHEWPKWVNCMPILCAQGWWAMRKMVAAILAACGLAIAPGAVGPAHAMPADCPPICDRTPNSAWIDPTQIPLYPTYRWPGLAGVAVTTTNPRFRSEEACASPPVPDDPRGDAVSARATVPQPDGQAPAGLPSPSLTTDAPDRGAAVISGVLPGQAVLHHDPLVNTRNSTI